MGKIIYKLNENKNSFIRKEKAIAALFIIPCISIVIVRVLNILDGHFVTFSDDFKSQFDIQKIINEVGLLVLMTIVFLTLIWYMSKHFFLEL